MFNFIRKIMDEDDEIRITVDGKEYKSQPETNWCDGCEFNGDDEACAKIELCVGIIYVKT